MITHLTSTKCHAGPEVMTEEHGETEGIVAGGEIPYLNSFLTGSSSSSRSRERTELKESTKEKR